MAPFVVSLAAQNFTIEFRGCTIFIDNDPSTDNIASSCTSILDRSSISYDLTLSLHLDETFTPAVIGAINFLRASTLLVNSNGDVIIAESTTRLIHLNVTQGPFTLNILFDDRPQLLNGLGYYLAVCNA